MKRATVLLITILISISSIFAVEFSMEALGTWTWETNKFSNPLPLFSETSFLNNVIDHPYLDRKDWGAKVNMNLFPISGSRAGISLSVAYGHPYSAIQTVPVPTDGSERFGSTNIDWEYVDREALSTQKGKIAIGLGGIFRWNYSFLEIGSAIRAVVSSFNYFDTVTFGFEAEPYIRTYFNNYAYLSLGLSFTCHIFHFINSESVLYETNFTQISLSPFVGLGFRIGGAV